MPKAEPTTELTELKAEVVKPGAQTTEFALVALFLVISGILVALTKLDAAMWMSTAWKAIAVYAGSRGLAKLGVGIGSK